MRRFLLEALAFAMSFLALAAALEASTAVWLTAPTQTVTDARKWADMLGPGPSPGLVVIGTSHAVYGVDPARLDAPGGAYNYGFRNATPRYHERWYELYRRHHAAPATLVWAVDWFAFRDHTNRVIEHDARFMPGPIFREVLADARTDRAKLLANCFTLYADRGRIKDVVTANPAGIHDMARFAHGYAPYATAAGEHRARTWGPGRPKPPNRRAFERLLDALARDGVRVALVQIPEYLPVSGRHAAENAEIAAIAAARGLPFLDYNGPLAAPINEDATAFYDWGHLNDAGCRRFTATLARDLRARGLLDGLEAAGRAPRRKES